MAAEAEEFDDLGSWGDHFGVPFGIILVPGGLFGVPWDLLEGPLGDRGCPLGFLGGSLGVFWALFGP